jgi:hypothetical protein
MATKRKTGKLAAAGKKVKAAAKTVVSKVEEHVVQPVGEALGLTKKKKSAPRKKAAAKSTAAATRAKRPATKRAPAKSKAKSK